MSKLYKSYIQLKEENPQKIYLFKSGMFYICLEDDSKKLSETFGFKITKLNEKIIKCGFPISRLDYYVEQLKKRNIQFEIVDKDYSKIENYKDYINNSNLKKVVQEIIKIDLNNITFREAYEFLEKIQLELEKIYNKEN